MCTEPTLQKNWRHIAEETAGIGFWRMDPSTGVVDWSPNMFRLFEFADGPAPKAEETMSRIHPDDRAEAYIDLSSNLQNSGHATISRIMLPSGGIRVVESRTIAERDPAGEITSIIGSVLDITARAERDDKARVVREAFNDDLMGERTHAADLSHELRTPLMAIISYAHLLNERTDMPAEARRDIDQLTKSSVALLSVANNLLGRSKAADLAKAGVKPTSINEIVENVLSIFSQQVSLTGVDLRYQVDENFPPLVETHADALTQILLNLVGNAVKFTKRGFISIAAGYDEDLEILSIAVRDTGPGFDEATRKQLFGRFAQGIGPQGPAGAGLGLSICKGLVDALQGSIEAEGVLGAGACFTVTMRASPCDLPQRTSGTLKNAVRVLVIDDHPANREIAGRILSGAGATVVAKDSAFSGLEAADSQAFDVILLDLSLPDMSGAEVAKIIRGGDGPNAGSKICAFTAEGMDQTSLPSCFDDLVAKPLDPRALVERLLKQG